MMEGVGLSQDNPIGDIGDYISRIEPVFFSALKKEGLLDIPGSLCAITSEALVKLLHAEFGLDIGGDSLNRIEIIPGVYVNGEIRSDHYWLAVYLGYERPVLYVDGSYGQFNKRYESKIICGPYAICTSMLSLKDDREEFYDKAENYLLEKRTNLSFDGLIAYLDEMFRFSVSIWEHPLMSVYSRYSISEEVRLKGSIGLTPQIEVMIDAVLRGLGYRVEVFEIIP